MTLNAGLMSSARESWPTPPGILDVVRRMGPIVLDPCGCEGDVVEAEESWRLERDGDSLPKSWARGRGLVYVNPPYGRAIGPFIQKCRKTWEVSEQEVVALVPARTDARWWHDAGACTICLLKGRLRFLGAPSSAPFPSALLYWGRAAVKVVGLWSGLGMAFYGAGYFKDVIYGAGPLKVVDGGAL